MSMQVSSSSNSWGGWNVQPVSTHEADEVLRRDFQSLEERLKILIKKEMVFGRLSYETRSNIFSVKGFQDLREDYLKIVTDQFPLINMEELSQRFDRKISCFMAAQKIYMAEVEVSFQD